MGLSNFVGGGGGGSSSSFGTGSGLSRMANRGTDQERDYTQRIANAEQRLTSIGQPIPVEPDKGNVLDGIFKALNFFNNKKNQTLSYVSGNKEAFDDSVSGAELLQQWGMEEGKKNQVAGFGFDMATDPLNLLSFGAAGAAGAAAKGGIKAGQLALEGGVKATPTVAKLGAFGKYMDVPGSGEVLGALGRGIKGTASKIGDFVERKAPELARMGEEATKLGGRLFVRGYGVPGAVNQITKESQDLFRMDTQDIVNEVTGMSKQWGDIDTTKIISAVESPDFYSKLKPNEVEAFNQVKDYFDMNFLKAQDAGVIDEFRANYIPHIFKGKKEDIAEAMEQIRRRGARVPTSSGFNKERNIMEDLSFIMKDPAMSAKLKPETDLGKIMGIYKVSLQKAIRNKDMIDELVNLGPDIIKRYDDGDVPTGWVTAPVQQLKGYAVPPDMARHLKDVLEPFTNSDSANKLFRLYDDVLGWWKGMATIPNPGFHMRNSLGNVFNNYLGGVRTLQPYRLAVDAVRADDSKLDDFYDLIRTRNNMDNSPVPLGTNLDTPGFNVPPTQINIARVFNEPRFKDIIMGGDGPKVKVRWEGQDLEVNMTGVKLLAKLNGIVGRGFIAGDISDGIGDVMRKFKSERNFQDFNPASRENIGFRAAEKIGTNLEDHARLAHFIDRLQKGDTPLDAGLSVKKYLFDYTNLTPFEKNVMKRFMPFYAFTRFNLPLQLKELVKQPKYATVMGKYQDFMENLSTEATGQEIDKDDLPRYLRDLYAVRLPFQAGDRDITLGIDLPIRDVNSIRPSEWFSMMTPLLTVPAEQAANKNVYFDRDLERYEGETVRAPGYLQGIFKMIKTMDPDAPQSKTFNQIANKMGFTIGIDEDSGQPELLLPVRAAHVMNQFVALKNAGKLADTVTGDSFDPFGSSSILTGASAVSNTADQRQQNSQYQEYQRLEDLLRKLRDEGRPVPTLDDIQQRRAGGGLSSLVGGR